MRKRINIIKRKFVTISILFIFILPNSSTRHRFTCSYRLLYSNYVEFANMVLKLAKPTDLECMNECARTHTHKFI